MTRRRPEPERCPGCGSTDIIPIVYGMPSYEAFLEEQRGELELGGCCVGPDQPEWRCRACGLGFRHAGRRARRA